MTQRIIAGRLKGRRLRASVTPGVRPTSDRLRETLFNVLRDRVDGAHVLDAFAGTGAVGLEALSRGARHVTFVEADRRAAAALRANIATCGVDEVSVVRQETLQSVRERREEPLLFDLVFLDPPYDFADLHEALVDAAALMHPAGVLVLEHARRREVPAAVGALACRRTVMAGDSALSLYERLPTADTMGESGHL
jgi:16S rRNA (guanine966-N2)-methyltransferase